MENLAPLAETRARRAMALAGLPTGVTVTRAESATNEVFLTASHVIRVSRRPTGRLRREATLCRALPARGWTPRIVAFGYEAGLDYLIALRRPGATLARWWPMLGRDQRATAARALGVVLSQLHQTACPPELPHLVVNPQLLEDGTSSPLVPIFSALERLRARGDVDAGVLRDAEDLLGRTGEAVVDEPPTHLVHGDLTLENVLWDGDDLTALIDFEWARQGPADLDLDVLLRFCAYPGAHLPAHLEDHVSSEDYAELPALVGETYPELFSHPRLLDRLRIYAVGFEVRELLAAPPIQALAHVRPLHPYRRLRQLLDGLSHLDRFREQHVI